MPRRALLAIATISALLGSEARQSRPLGCSTAQIRGAKYATCEIPAASLPKLEIASRDRAGAPIGTVRRLDSLLSAAGRRLRFATNAGIFDSAGTPTGLLVVNGEVARNLDTTSGPSDDRPICERANFYCPPNGVFFVADDGAHVWTTAAFLARYGVTPRPNAIRLATQSGPMLLRAGQLARPFNARSASRLVRNGVCVRVDGTVLLALVDRVNLHDFATDLRDHFRCRDALFLDGNVSELWENKAPSRSSQEFGALLFVADPLSRARR